MCVYVHVYAYTCTCTRKGKCKCKCIHTRIYIYISIDTHIHIRIRMHLHTHIHTHQYLNRHTTKLSMLAFVWLITHCTPIFRHLGRCRILHADPLRVLGTTTMCRGDGPQRRHHPGLSQFAQPLWWEPQLSSGLQGKLVWGEDHIRLCYALLFAI